MEGVGSIPVGQLRSYPPCSTAKKKKKNNNNNKKTHQNIQYPNRDTHSYTFG